MPRVSKAAKLMSEISDWKEGDLEKLMGLIRNHLSDRASGKPGQKAHGEHIEIKMIPGPNGRRNGPYRYRRWWQDGKLKTQYLGKASAQEESEYFDAHPEDRPSDKVA